MRRLEILLIGASPALQLLHRELYEHGHALHLADSAEALLARPWRQPQLLIDDGSLALRACDWQALGDCALLSLRLGVYVQTPDALPTLELLCWTGSATAQRLIERQRLAPERSGNGQHLRLHAIDSLRDMLALLVSRFSRNPEYLQQAAAISPGQQDQEQGLDWLEQMACFHRFNQTGNPTLLAAADVPLIERLEQSLCLHADKTALNLNGQRINYAQLHAQAAAIQHVWVFHRPAPNHP